MRRTSHVALILLAATSAAAQDTSLDGELALRGELASSREDSCSRSMGHGGTTAELALTVDRAGAAELAIDVRTHDTIVSLDGDPIESSSSTTQSHTRLRLRGTATRIGGVLELRFVEVERAHALWMGHGTLPLPAATRIPWRGGGMRCELARIDVLPAQAASGERASSTSLARCTMSPWPDELEGWDHALLGAGRGVRITRDALGSPIEPIRRVL